MSDLNGERGPRPEWPTTVPDAPTLHRFFVAQALHAFGVTQGCVDAGLFNDDDHSGRLWTRYMAAVPRMIALHDDAVLLAALIEADPAKADAVAERCWTAAEAGDAYGEWLWQWAAEAGLDADAITREGIEHGAASGGSASS